MTSTRIATLATAVTIALVAVGGTALALGADDTPAPAPVPVTATGQTTSATPTPTPTSTPTSAATPADDTAGRERAVAVALERVGGGRVTGVERESEHGRGEWKIEIVRGETEHDVRVDAVTGAVTRVGADDRSDEDRGRSDDGPGHDVGDDHGGDRGRGGDDD